MLSYKILYISLTLTTLFRESLVLSMPKKKTSFTLLFTRRQTRKKNRSNFFSGDLCVLADFQVILSRINIFLKLSDLKKCFSFVLFKWKFSLSTPTSLWFDFCPPVAATLSKQILHTDKKRFTSVLYSFFRSPSLPILPWTMYKTALLFILLSPSPSLSLSLSLMYFLHSLICY